MPLLALDQTFHALADPTRRAIISRLRAGTGRVTDLAGEFDVSLNAVSKHIKVLERAGLVDREIRGREHFIHLNAAPLAAAEDWIAHYRKFWTARLSRLDNLMRDRGRRRPDKSGKRNSD